MSDPNVDRSASDAHGDFDAAHLSTVRRSVKAKVWRRRSAVGGPVLLIAGASFLLVNPLVNASGPGEDPTTIEVATAPEVREGDVSLLGPSDNADESDASPNFISVEIALDPGLSIAAEDIPEVTDQEPESDVTVEPPPTAAPEASESSEATVDRRRPAAADPEPGDGSATPRVDDEPVLSAPDQASEAAEAALPDGDAEEPTAQLSPAVPVTTVPVTTVPVTTSEDSNAGVASHANDNTSADPTNDVGSPAPAAPVDQTASSTATNEANADQGAASFASTESDGGPEGAAPGDADAPVPPTSAADATSAADKTLEDATGDVGVIEDTSANDTRTEPDNNVAETAPVEDDEDGPAEIAPAEDGAAEDGAESDVGTPSENPAESESSVGSENPAQSESSAEPESSAKSESSAESESSADNGQAPIEDASDGGSADSETTAGAADEPTDADVVVASGSEAPIDEAPFVVENHPVQVEFVRGSVVGLTVEITLLVTDRDGWTAGACGTAMVWGDGTRDADACVFDGCLQSSPDGGPPPGVVGEFTFTHTFSPVAEPTLMTPQFSIFTGLECYGDVAHGQVTQLLVSSDSVALAN